MKVLLGCIISVLGLSGCVGFVAPVETDAQPEPKQAYIYTNLSVDSDGGSLGLLFKCPDGVEFTVGFRRSDEVLLMPVPVAKCSWSEIVFTNGSASSVGKKKNSSGMLQNVQFEPMTAYYLGDMKAKVSVKVEGRYISTSWKMTSVRDRYVTTTEEMKAKYKAFSGIKTVNLMEMTPSEEPAKTEEDKAE